MSEKRVCLWVSLERPTEAQRDELLNTRGVTDIVEKEGIELAHRRYSDEKARCVLELTDIAFKSEEDEKLFVKELRTLVKSTGAEVLAGDYPMVSAIYDLSEEITVYLTYKTVTVLGEGQKPEVNHFQFVKCHGIRFFPAIPS